MNSIDPQKLLRAGLILAVAVNLFINASGYGLDDPALLSKGSPGNKTPEIVPNSDGYPTSLSWKNGVPVLQVSRPEDVHLKGFISQNTPLIWRSGELALELHPLLMEFHFLGKYPSEVGGRLGFRVVDDSGTSYGLRLRHPQDLYHEFPIRLIETGNWFQHVTVVQFELLPIDSKGPAFPVEGRMEWRTWNDAGSVELVLENPELLSIRRVEAIWDAGRNKSTVVGSSATQSPLSLFLQYSLNGSELPVWVSPKEQPQGLQLVNSKEEAVVYESSTMAWEIRLKEQEWGTEEGSNFPLSQLDRITRLPFIVHNPTGEEQIVRLRFMHPSHPNIGFVPLLLDGEGRQTGFPVQVSKNWHTRSDKPRLPNDGKWVRTSTSLKVPPHSSREFIYAIVHAQWQGVPSASVAQLSLVGWGSNGFWLQSALGSWGEHFCFQPGRALRRSMITDIRPLFQEGMSGAGGYNWTSNVGGGDVGLIHDVDGRYVPWKDEMVDFKSPGPVVSEVSIVGTTIDDSARLRTTVILPRSDDILRVFLRLEFEALKSFEFSRFALFQLGTDYYASGRSSTLQWGSGVDDAREVDVGSAGVPWTGPSPWVWLPGELENGPKDRIGHAQRAMILRAFEGKVGGQDVDHAWLYSFPVADRAPNVNAELGLSPTTTAFMPGDFLSALVEIILLPATADDYRGPDETLRKLLNQKEGVRNAVINEALMNQAGLKLNDGSDRVSPLPELSYLEAQKGFSFSGGLGWIPVKVTGAPAPSSVKWMERFNGKLSSLGERFPGERGPQWTWRPETDDWTVYLSLRPPGNGEEPRQFLPVEDNGV